MSFVFFADSLFSLHLMQPEFTFRKIKEARDAYVKRLNGIYHDNLGKDNIDEINGTAKFVGPKTYALPSSPPLLPSPPLPLPPSHLPLSFMFVSFSS